MKKLMIALLMTSGLLVLGAGCNKDKGGGDGDGKAGSADTGVPECDEYIKKFEGCMSKTPEAGKAAMEQSLKAQRDGFKQGASTPEGKAALKTSCKQMTDGLASNPACK